MISLLKMVYSIFWWMALISKVFWNQFEIESIWKSMLEFFFPVFCLYFYFLPIQNVCQLIETKKKKMFYLGAGNGTAAEGNGCVRFVEIATQTVNLTNILTNLNSSVTNYNNTSDICIEEIQTQIASNALNANDSISNANQSHNSKNGHCVTDGISTNNNKTDSVAHDTQPHHATEICDDDESSIIDTNTLDSTNMEATVKMDCKAVTMDACESTEITKLHTENDATDEIDPGSRMTATEAINGPTSDFRV